MRPGQDRPEGCVWVTVPDSGVPWCPVMEDCCYSNSEEGRSHMGGHTSSRTECWWPGVTPDFQPTGDEVGVRSSHPKKIITMIADSNKCLR